MGRYVCPKCAEPTVVIETRLSSTRIRRRRLCPSGHRFNTLEVALDVQSQLHELVKWLGKHIGQENEDYAHSRVDTIVMGLSDDEDE